MQNKNNSKLEMVLVAKEWDGTSENGPTNKSVTKSDCPHHFGTQGERFTYPLGLILKWDFNLYEFPFIGFLFIMDLLIRTTNQKIITLVKGLKSDDMQ